MLAQNFKTPTDLGISDVEFDALTKVLGMLERGEIPEGQFRMETFRRDTMCGTVGCIAGWANTVSHGEAFPLLKNGGRYVPAAGMDSFPPALQTLFGINQVGLMLCKPTTAQAAVALRNYLTFGDSSWEEVLAS